ncbi:MAG TPA: hypothetical protein PKE26_06515 [Kiritimatiellia bacterium]|nr:hypothetical protein [Kiritimatiellia bacterium]HMO98747.1 hypothetical protein [Kiritimatiellia bacterium]HMP95923.1 hypothetical protein [Kiritimatiellia bacterium]
MKKIIMTCLSAAALAGLWGCELDNNKGRDLRFENLSSQTVSVIPLTGEWESFKIAPDETKKLESIKTPDFTWEPKTRVALSVTSTDRRVVFVNKPREPAPPPPTVIIITNQ